MDRSSLVPVHADAGGVTFNYEIAQFSLGGKAPKRLASPVTVPQTAEDAQENSENSVDPSGDDLPNFLAVGAQPADGEDPAEVRPVAVLQQHQGVEAQLSFYYVPLIDAHASLV